MALFNKFKQKESLAYSENGIRSIARNLNNILNTKKDYGSPLREYGIRDLNEFNDREGMIHIIIQEVIRCVEEYEPRISTVNIIKQNETDEMFKLSFRIECVVRDGKESMNMVFDTMVNRFLVENV